MQRFRGCYLLAFKGKAEADYIFQRDAEIIPIEVKSEDSIRAASLEEHIDRYSSSNAVLVSKKNVKVGPMTHVPLPPMWLFRELT